MSDKEAEFREFVAARMESLRGLAYVTCGDWQTAEDAVVSALAKLFGKWNCSMLSPDGRFAITASSGGSAPQSEMLKILASVRYDGSSSYLVSAALPESALPER